MQYQPKHRAPNYKPRHAKHRRDVHTDALPPFRLGYPMRVLHTDALPPGYVGTHRKETADV